MAIIKLALTYLANAVMLLIIIRCILSWIPGLQNRFVQIVYNLTEPLLAPVRKMIGKFTGGRPMVIDLSPIVVFLIIEILIVPAIRAL